MIPPEFPEELTYLWQMYQTVYGSEELTYGEIVAWAEATGTRLLEGDAGALRELDRVRLRARQEDS